jgi:hypothetical protein
VIGGIAVGLPIWLFIRTQRMTLRSGDRAAARGLISNTVAVAYDNGIA